MSGSKERSQNYSRSKGNRAEQLYAIRFRDLGFAFCRTSREQSKILDACGIDLCGIPVSIQIKSGFKKKRPNSELLLKKIRLDLKKRFPPEDPIHNVPRAIVHKSQGYTEEGELVTMTWDDWLLFFNAYVKQYGMQENKTPDNLCSG